MADEILNKVFESLQKFLKNLEFLCPVNVVTRFKYILKKILNLYSKSQFWLSAIHMKNPNLLWITLYKMDQKAFQAQKAFQQFLLSYYELFLWKCYILSASGRFIPRRFIPGLKRLGLKRLGLKRPGLKRPGLKRPGLKRLGLKWPELKRPGLNRTETESSRY